jgi:DNA replication protein DnaC
MSQAAISKELIPAQARDLKMPGLGRVYEQLGRQAREEHWTHEDYLHEALAAEQASRLESAVRNRIHDARFPELKTLDAFDFAATDGAVSPALISDLARGEWISRAENLILAGPIGTGKTHLAIALGIEAARRRRRVLFMRAADLVRSLLEARDNRELTRLHRRLQYVELLIVDELGFVPFDRPGGELLFNLFTERYERRSIIVTTNLPFAEWVTIFRRRREAHHGASRSPRAPRSRHHHQGQELPHAATRATRPRRSRSNNSARLRPARGRGELPIDWMEWLATSPARSQ